MQYLRLIQGIKHPGQQPVGGVGGSSVAMPGVNPAANIGGGTNPFTNFPNTPLGQNIGNVGNMLGGLLRPQGGARWGNGDSSDWKGQMGARQYGAAGDWGEGDMLVRGPQDESYRNYYADEPGGAAPGRAEPSASDNLDKLVRGQLTPRDLQPFTTVQPWRRQGGARSEHEDVEQDRKLIEAVLKKHGLLKPQAGARHHDLEDPGWFRMPPHHTEIHLTVQRPDKRERQAGARAPMAAMHPRQHSLSMASATHLKNMGAITGAQHATIHKNALSALASHKRKAGALPSMMPPQFGSLAPPPMMGGPPTIGPSPDAGMPPPSMMGGPPMMPPMQMGARQPYSPSGPRKYHEPKYGAQHYMSTPTPVSSGAMGGGTGQSGGSAGARAPRRLPWEY
jgi:hypothetical protein